MRKIPGYDLWIGHVGDVRDLHMVLSAGFEAIVDLALNEPPAIVPRELVYCRFPLDDGSGNRVWVLKSVIETISLLLQMGTPTFVFCSAGMSRSPLIAAAAIANFREIPLVDALAIVTEIGPVDISPGLLSDVSALMGGEEPR